MATRRKNSPAKTPDVDRTSRRRRLYEQVAIPTEGEIEDWQSTAFDSSRVRAAMYSASRQELRVEWVNAPGGIPYPPYIYDGVSESVWENFRLASSPGRFVNTILNQYQYRPAPELRGSFGG